VDVAQVVAAWLHTLGMVIVIGYYGILGRFVLPAMRRSLDGASVVHALVAVERRARPFLVIATVLFAVTGVYLLAIDDQFTGIGSVRESSWAALMLLKHLVVVAVLGAGIVVDVLAGWAGEAGDPGVRDRSVGRVGLAADAAAALGALALLLTAVAQGS
jgi:uncharacterized membrane protein